MTITRINQFEAQPGKEGQLHQFLQSVIAIIQTCPGAISVRLLRSVEHAAEFAIIEEWEDVASHRQAASAIPAEKMAEAVALFAKAPSGAYYQP
jgi:quinol monooxygenase YgiN